MKALCLVVALLVTATTANATPGALNAAGCHGAHGRMGYHCHTGGHMSYATGQHFIPGHFSHHGGGHRRSHKH
jgi:hypothetical protein